MKTSALTAAFLAATVGAAPLDKRANIDITILQYALTLENLEATFYAQALNQYSAADFAKAKIGGAGLYRRLQIIASDEATHVSTLASVIKAAGGNPVAACTYDFGYKSPAGFLEVASILEGVGVSAYLGAAALVTNKDYLTAAGSILTVEARHNAFIRQTDGTIPFPSPFDTPLDFNQVYTLAAGFIKSCPSSNAALPVKAFPALSAKPQDGAFKRGGPITFMLPKGFKYGSYGGQKLYVAWPGSLGTEYTPVTGINKNAGTATSTVPTTGYGASGQAYAILTTSGSALTDKNTLAGPAVVEVAVST